MPNPLNLNAGQVRNFNQRLHRVEVVTGDVIFALNADLEQAEILKPGDVLDLRDAPTWALYAPESATALLTYTEEAPARGQRSRGRGKGREGS